MKKIFPLIVIFIIIAVALAATVAAAQSGRRIAPTPPPAPTPEPQPAVEAPRQAEAPSGVRTLPESIRTHEFQSLDKGSFRLADFGGKVIVINLWATWCGPCRSEIPEYEEVRKDYVSRGVEFFGLTTENPASDTERVKKFVREFDFNFRVAWLDRQTAVTLMNGRSVIPQTIVVAADGSVVEHWRGYSHGRGAQMLRTAIDRALAAGEETGGGSTR
jgi:thiol-disulfide isomerase/thioredoxin